MTNKKRVIKKDVMTYEKAISIKQPFYITADKAMDMLYDLFVKHGRPQEYCVASWVINHVSNTPDNTLHYTQNYIAKHSSISRPVVSSTLHKLNQYHFIRLGRKSITVIPDFCLQGNERKFYYILRKVFPKGNNLSKSMIRKLKIRAHTDMKLIKKYVVLDDAKSIVKYSTDLQKCKKLLK